MARLGAFLAERLACAVAVLDWAARGVYGPRVAEVPFSASYRACVASDGQVAIHETPHPDFPLCCDFPLGKLLLGTPTLDGVQLGLISRFLDVLEAQMVADGLYREAVSLDEALGRVDWAKGPVCCACVDLSAYPADQRGAVVARLEDCLPGQCLDFTHTARFLLQAPNDTAAFAPVGVTGFSAAHASFPQALSGEAQARMALQYAQGAGEKAAHFNEVRFQLLRENGRASLQKQGLEESLFYRPELFALLRYDAENGADYTQSVYGYLRSGKNLKEAAHALGVHRNTLQYRIDRVAERFGIDFANRNTCFELLFSCKLYFTGEGAAR